MAFQDAVRDLPINGDIRTKYSQFIKNFGTHYVQAVYMGAKYLVQSEVNNHHLNYNPRVLKHQETKAFNPILTKKLVFVGLGNKRPNFDYIDSCEVSGALPQIGFSYAPLI